MNANLQKPLPVISNLNRPYWEGTKKHELRLQRCTSCARLWAPHGPVCPYCLSEEFNWEKLSGRGRIASWVVFHKVYFPSFEKEIPYNVAFIELEEGPRIIANVVGVPREELRIGMKVEVVFEDINDEVTVPKFRKIEAE